jgi:hypothetical protein
MKVRNLENIFFLSDWNNGVYHELSYDHNLISNDSLQYNLLHCAKIPNPIEDIDEDFSAVLIWNKKIRNLIIKLISYLKNILFFKQEGIIIPIFWRTQMLSF